MIKLVELNYHCHTQFNRPGQAIEKHALSSGYIHFIKHRVNLLLVKHLNYHGQAAIENIRYAFFKSRNRFWYIPFATHRFIKKEKPDVILVQGFVFVWQVMALRYTVGKQCRILLQHHGEQPFTGIKGFFQRMMDGCVNGYLFTGLGNADSWMKMGVIGNSNKCYTLLSASTSFTVKDKAWCKQQTGITGTGNFIWVGRLNSNKDPITVIRGFELYLSVNPAASLYMIYQTEELLAAVQVLLSNNILLQRAVHLIGKIAHEQLEDWYNAADYYLSGSHSEGSGYALVEAMACGCIPVVTSIPSFKKITMEGAYGFLFEPGNIASLFKKLTEATGVNTTQYHKAIHEYSKKQLSYAAVADQLYQLVSAPVTK